MTLSDGEGLAQLSIACPDTGSIPYRTRYVADPYRAFCSQLEAFEGVVAVLRDTGQLIGCCLVAFSHRVVGGEPRPCALLNTLMVHPAWRRVGAASAMTRWCQERARERHGQEGLVTAAVQQGNLGSLSSLRRIGLVEGGAVQAGVVRMRRAPPERPPGLEVRPATVDELRRVADGLNVFYAGHDYYEPQSETALASWLAATAGDGPVHQLWVATGRGGELKAGLGLFSRGRLMEMCFGPLSLPLRMLNGLLSIIPGDGVVRELVAEKLWFQPGEEEAARYLWEFIRWQWRNDANVLRVHVGTRSPIARIPRFPFWLPRATLHVCSNQPPGEGAQRPIYPF